MQAREGSARLPQKVLLKILGKSVTELAVERLRRVQDIDNIILVTGEKEKNEKLVQEAERIGIPYFCGSEDNVLDRFYQAAKVFQPQAIIRVTGDCPLIDATILNEGLTVFKEGNYDIVGNTRVRTYPDGMDFEVFSSAALATAWQKDLSRLHPTQYMWREKEFRIRDITRTPNLSHMRLTLDYAEDFTLIKAVYEHLYPQKQDFSMEDILRFLEVNPQLLEGNRKYIKLDYGLGE
ncbi:MAG: glycosyltransferase family protein [Candidatus Wildermuthbacteria bacterium]|nr:glycosyltransferase family protein [Candidatus Wildermuthbacteria bacterium]